jgi:DNA-binding NarL/FixJ family response regulator
MIDVVIAEDYHLVREGIRRLLDEADDIQVVGEAEDGDTAFTLTAQLIPDVLVLDFKMPHSNGLHVAQLVKGLEKDIKIVILSMHADETIVRQALRIGVAGYVLKQSVSAELLLSIRAAQMGGMYFSAGISQYLLPAVSAARSKNPLDLLSPREREVVQMVVNGHTSQQIANTFTTSVKTVEKQRRSAMQKLGVHDVATLVRVCMKLGLNINEAD